MEAVVKLIAHYIDVQVEDIKLDADIRELVADSLDRIELIMALEDEFDINIPDDDIDKLATVRDIANYVENNTTVVGVER
jgi:acyl carrier protein